MAAIVFYYKYKQSRVLQVFKLIFLMLMPWDKYSTTNHTKYLCINMGLIQRIHFCEMITAKPT